MGPGGRRWRGPRSKLAATAAEASGARGTPTFFIGTRRHIGPHDTQTLIKALEAVRADH